MSTYQVTARNFNTDSENRMHSNAVAQSHGFRGALVPGVAVYGHLVQPLVEKFGEQWLGQSQTALRLLKPAYDGDELSIVLTTEPDGQYRIKCHNQEDLLLAEIIAGPMLTMATDIGLDGPAKATPKVEIHWDNVVPEEVFVEKTWSLSESENNRYCEEISDHDLVYKEHIHPHYILSLANYCLMEEYLMPAWIHASSITNHRSALMVGDEITSKTVVKEKFERKGHQFITIHITYWRGEELTTDILHTAIFRIAE
jgi:hypothetical protein|tara:strand:- start:1539 stop:2306 length:768 start_codon:yes stop_codon:yes gene_type:complete